MQARRGFTLVELLVVIAVLVVLMGLLFPVLRRARESARAVVCQGRHRQAGLAFSLYVEDNDGRLPRVLSGTNGIWLLMTQPRWRDYPKLLLCPSAAQTLPGDPEVGDKFHAYAGALGSLPSSFGFNYCAHYRETPDGRVNPSPNSSPTWHTAYVREAPKVPVFFDCAADNVWITDNCGPPPQEGFDQDVMMSSVCLNRHHGGINVLFMDWSVRKVGLKELWTLKWTRHYDTTNSWTKAGGVKPEDWPDWMRQFKDY